MDLRQLQTFVAIYESGGISRAAERERTAPSVLSHHLANLENQFPKPLFVRNPRGLLPTEFGERLHAHAVQILRAVQLAQEDIHNMSGEIHGQVAIGMAYTALHGIGKQLMRTVIDDYPGLSLMLSETLSGSTITQMMEAHIDLALAYNPTQDTRIKATALLEERMICIGKKEIIGDTAAPITVKALLDLPFVLPRRGTMGRSIMDDPRLQKQFEQRAKMQTDNVNAVNLFVEEGLGCVIGSKSYLREQLKAGEVVYRDIVKPEMLRTLFLCEHSDKPPSRAVELIREIVLRLIATEVKAGNWACERVLLEPAGWPD
ncbi:LysR family transcriptional regulator [Alcaligenaceae bacterium]|nr:LysR family transcriptional regulator [Alcaligenaceae bacterium]